jgi:hypothetical protein
MGKQRVVGLVMLVGFAVSPALSADHLYSRALVNLTPLAAPYVYEVGGNLTVTFAQDLDPDKFSFGAGAYDLTGKAKGNDTHSSVPAPAGTQVFIHCDDHPGAPMVTTIRFKDLPLKEVKTVQIFIFSDRLNDRLSVRLPASFGKAPAAPVPLTFTIGDRAGHKTVTTSTGLVAEAAGSFGEGTSGGTVVSARLVTAKVSTLGGEEVLEADVLEMRTDASAAVVPATAPSTRP